MESSELVAQFARRDRRALARLLTRIEAGQPLPVEIADELATYVHSSAPRTLVVGIAGSGGAGKSTLIGRLIGHVRDLGKSVAVLASDPQSPVSGGALLGDRIRVPLDPTDERVYFRSFSTRGSPGGISAAVAPALPLLAAYGFDVVLVETVGIGQDQVAIRSVVDRLALLVTPAAGDEVQWEKAGLIELADVVVVNKFDLPGSARVAASLTSALSLVPDSTAPPVLGVVATTGEGIAELWRAISEAGRSCSVNR